MTITNAESLRDRLRAMNRYRLSRVSSWQHEMASDDSGEWVRFADAERVASLAAQQWMPIETAPKDGTEVLVRCRNRAGLPGTVVAHYCSWVEDHPPIDAAWYFWNGGQFVPATKPTHWMPLPAPPEEQP